MVRRNVCIVIAIVALLCGSCRPASLPGVRDYALREQQRITDETRSAIAQSQSLREVDSLYTREVVAPADFKLVRMSRDFKQETFLVYGYQSTKNWNDVKTYYRSQLAGVGWQLNDEQDKVWGQDFIRFQKQTYQVTLYKASKGSGENYTVVCKKV